MKLTVLTAIAGIAIAAAVSSPAIDEPETFVYSVPLKSYQGQSSMEFWSELANEANFMQEQIELGRTIEQCKEDCNTAKEENRDFNRGRCRQNCENMDPNDRSGSCRDCYSNYGEGNRRDRCLESCDAGNARRCEDASNCDECRSYCRSGERSSCYRDVDPRDRCERDSDRRPGQRCGGQREPRCRGSNREVVCCPNDPRNGRSYSYRCLNRGQSCPRYALEGADQLDFLMDHS
mmetsp:Transcript_15845/g.36504  ORF Transcript_15845/g.36504 Transcript_15845/m.36504 type:complete len:234 (+) Transcript_15845:114-815(+)